MNTNKTDLYKMHAADYVAAKRPGLVDIEPAQYLSISGQGAPGEARFTACVGALYSVAFTIKMRHKFAGKQEYAICKLEGLWFDGDLVRIPRQQWNWKLLIRTPEFISKVDLADAVSTLLERGKSREVGEVKLETIVEGSCVQMLHVGPYEREHESVALLREFARLKGMEFAGPHHDVYLSDPRRVVPEELRTIVRVPVSRRAARRVGAALDRAPARPSRRQHRTPQAGFHQGISYRSAKSEST